MKYAISKMMIGIGAVNLTVEADSIEEADELVDNMTVSELLNHVKVGDICPRGSATLIREE